MIEYKCTEKDMVCNDFLEPGEELLVSAISISKIEDIYVFQADCCYYYDLIEQISVIQRESTLFSMAEQSEDISGALLFVMSIPTKELEVGYGKFEEKQRNWLINYGLKILNHRIYQYIEEAKKHFGGKI